MKKIKKESDFNIFRKGSTTYFYSSLLFPSEIRKKVFKLYAFVRTADNFVDSIPQDKKGFYRFKKETILAFSGKVSNDVIVRNMINLSKEVGIHQEWVMSFLDAMESDLKTRWFETYEDLRKYMYGSASVIGLMMAKIFGLPEKSFPYAMAQGEAMQLLNFIRDVKEDLMLKRVYIPQEFFKKYSVAGLCPEGQNQKKNFIRLIRSAIRHYRQIQRYAEKGYKYIPKRYLISVKTATDMYNWTADEIYKNPLVILTRKIKPKPMHVLSKYLLNIKI